MLTASAGDFVSAERLTDALWGDRPPKSSAAIVHDLVSQLRRLLGAEVVGTAPGGYVLRALPADVDALRFEQLVQDGRQWMAAGDSAAAAEALSMALGLWRGAPLAELDDWPPARAEAVRLEEQRRCVLEELADAELACGRHQQWVSRLEAMVLEEPFRERRWSALMMALYRCGRQTDALRAFSALVRPWGSSGWNRGRT